MTKDQPKRKLTVRSERRHPPDYRKLSRALLALAIAQAEKDAQAEHESRAKPNASRGVPKDAA